MRSWSALLGSLMMVGIGIAGLVQNVPLMRNGRSTKGIVVASHRNFLNHSRCTYAYVVAGVRYEKEESCGNTRDVAMDYLPNSPRFASHHVNRGFVVGLSGVLLVLGLGGVAALVIESRNR